MACTQVTDANFSPLTAGAISSCVHPRLSFWSQQFIIFDDERHHVMLSQGSPELFTLGLCSVSSVEGLLHVAGLSFSHHRHSDEDGEATPSIVDALEGLSELPTWSWWTVRVLLMNQRLLARSAASLRSALTLLMPQVRCICPLQTAESCPFGLDQNEQTRLPRWMPHHPSDVQYVVCRPVLCPSNEAFRIMQSCRDGGFVHNMTRSWM